MTRPNTDAAFAREHGLKGTEMTLNVDLTDLSDVTDEGLEAALRMAEIIKIGPADVRRHAGWTGAEWAKAIILLARCIQAHYPEMIVDSVTRKAREICENEDTSDDTSGYFTNGKHDNHPMMNVAKAAIRAGMAMRGEG